MKKNVGTIDRTLRILVAVGIAVFYWTGLISGTMAIIFGVVATIFFVTSFAGFCPLYRVCNISTKPQ